MVIVSRSADVSDAGSPCRSCGTRLVSDQRYCLSCGTRRGALPPQVAAELAAIERPGSLALSAPAAEALRPAAGGRSGWSIPSPQAAAVAVMATLSFGALVGQGAESLATQPPVILAVSPTLASGGPSVAAAVGNTGNTGTGPGAAAAAARVVVVTQQAAAAAPSASANTGTGSAGTANGVLPPLPPIKHVFLIVLSGQGYNQSFGPVSKAKYLNRTLVPKGEVLTNYYAVAQGELANGLALLSGQGPTLQTEQGCPRYTPFTVTGFAKLGQVTGSGCVYPKKVTTLPDQLTAAHKTWRAYVEGLGAKQGTGAATCRHVKPGSVDPYSAPSDGQPYASRRNPFVYFSSLVGSGQCTKNDVGLAQLSRDLKTAAATPALSYVVPGLCDDGASQSCKVGAASGLAPADDFLRKVVPVILHSPAYKDKGLIAITFDQAPQTGLGADQSSCCNNPTYPNLPATSTSPAAPSTTSATTPASASPPATTSTATAPASSGSSTITTPIPVLPAVTVPVPGLATPTTTGPTTTAPTTTAPPAPTPGTTTPTASTPGTTTPTTTTPALNPALSGGQTSPTGGGGQVGMLLISSFVKPGTSDVIDYLNHYSFLASVEKLFSLKPLGYGLDPQLPTLGHAAFNAYTGG